ncbi:MAG TPA: hypothetical protein VGQ49_05635 [Bryobacteraceae bacterium]|nr:hypothetical protein [Bryobacteraceae bacterium]
MLTLLVASRLCGELRCRDTGTANGEIGNYLLTGMEGTGHSSVTVVRGDRSVKLFLPDKTRAIEWDLAHDLMREISFEEQIYSEVTFTQLVNSIPMMLAPFKLGARNMDTRVSSVDSKDGVSVGGVATRKVELTTIIDAPLLRDGAIDAGKLMPRISVFVKNELWIAPKIPGYQAMTDFAKRFDRKVAAAASDSKVVLGFRNWDVIGMLKDIASEAAQYDGMPVYQKVSFYAAVDSKADRQTTEGLPLLSSAEIVTQCFDVPPDQDDPFTTEASLRGFTKVVNTLATLTQQSDDIGLEPQEKSETPPLLQRGKPPEYKKSSPPKGPRK